MALETEIARYEELLPELLKSSEGKIAVIKGRDLLGTFNSMNEAYETLLPKYGFEQWLMRPIEARRPIYDLTNLHFGLISVKR